MAGRSILLRTAALALSLPAPALVIGCVGSPTAPVACPGGTCADGSTGDRAAGGGPETDAGTGRDSVSAVPGLVAAYGFDESGGSVAVDSSGNFLNAGLIGPIAWGAGRRGSGVSFGGGYVALPPRMLDDAHELTLAAWVRVRTDQLWQRVFDFGSGTTAYLFLTTRSDALIPTLRFAITRAGYLNEQLIEVVDRLPLGQWKHVAVVLGPAGGALYVDGLEVARNPALTLRPADLGEMSNDWLGRSQFPYDRPFDGDIDEVRIYSRALAASEIAALVNGP